MKEQTTREAAGQLLAEPAEKIKNTQVDQSKYDDMVEQKISFRQTIKRALCTPCCPLVAEETQTSRNYVLFSFLLSAF